ncbi:hypothetical protein [Cognatiyoonia sp. IB215182]
MYEAAAAKAMMRLDDVTLENSTTYPKDWERA